MHSRCQMPPLNVWCRVGGVLDSRNREKERRGRFLTLHARSDVRDRIISLGAEVAGSTPEELSNFIETQVTRWKRVLKSEHRS